MVYKKLALQIPLYYNTKTSTQNGTWKMGIGLDIHLNDFITLFMTFITF
ncbi:hypothetical protein [Chryseobacterium wanjuense]